MGSLLEKSRLLLGEEVGRDKRILGSLFVPCVQTEIPFSGLDSDHRFPPFLSFFLPYHSQTLPPVLMNVGPGVTKEHPGDSTKTHEDIQSNRFGI